MSSLVPTFTLVLGALLTYLAQSRIARQQTKDRREDRAEDGRARRAERSADVAERREIRLNEQRAALYPEVLAWARTWREPEPPPDLLIERVLVFGGDPVRAEFEGLVRSRSLVNKAALIEDPEAVDRAARLTGLEPEDLRARLRSDLSTEMVKIVFGPGALEDACRAELQGLPVDWS